jgi:hypothetical protein
MTTDANPAQRAPEKAPILDIGAGDPEAPANAIPNLIAHLVETETWRNASTVIMVGLLIGLGYWAYNGVRDSIALARVTSLEALLGAAVEGLDVWVGEHTAEAARLAKDPQVVERAARLAADAQRLGTAPGRCTAEAEDLGRTVQSSLSTRGVVAFRIIDRTGLVLASKDAARCGQRLRFGPFRQRLDLALTARVRASVSGSGGFRRGRVGHRPVVVSAPVPPAGDARRRARHGRGRPQLATIFSAAPRDTAEACTIPDDGLMLTPSRFGVRCSPAGS